MKVSPKIRAEKFENENEFTILKVDHCSHCVKKPKRLRKINRIK